MIFLYVANPFLVSDLSFASLAVVTEHYKFLLIFYLHVGQQILSQVL